MDRPHALTKLDRFCQHHKLTTTRLAANARLSRKHVTNVRRGRVQSPGLEVVSKLTAACKRLTGEAVEIHDLFQTTDVGRRKAS